jgi:adenylate cyclase
MSEEAPESRGPAPANPPAAVQPPPKGTDDDAPHIQGHAHGHHPRIEFRLLEQLKHRNVIRVGILYVVVCWLILDPVHVVFHMLEVPVWANRLVVTLMAIGFPAVLLFAWVYEITPEGLKLTVEVEPSRSIRKQTGQRLNRAIFAVMAVALTYFAVDKFWLSQHVATEQPATPAASVVLGTAPPATAISDKSVAVLPFIDMSEKKDQEYFSDGLSEELIDMLTKIPDLRVPARTSSFYFKDKSEDIPTIARRLMVAHVLEGSVRKSGNYLRVTAQLVRADNGYHVWSETYDRQLDDIFKMQDEIAGAVVKALKASLLEKEASSATLTTSSEAYELYLQARSLINRESSDDILKAYADLQQAVTLDPKFALAWATLAEILAQDNVEWYRVFNHVDSTSQTQGNPLPDWRWAFAQAGAAARAAAEQAVKLRPDLPESHAAMAEVLEWVDWDWAAADAQLKRARELEPGNARITLAAAQIAIDLGRVSEGLQLAHRAAALDPLGQAIRVIGWGQYVSGALDEAQLSRRKLIELYPTAREAHYHYALVLLARGESHAALSEFERESLAGFLAVGPPLGLDALGRPSDADRAIAIAEQKYGNVMAYQIAYIYASRKDFERTFYWLERAFRQHDGGLAYLKVDPMFRNLERDPRYKALLRKLRLAE